MFVNIRMDSTYAGRLLCETLETEKFLIREQALKASGIIRLDPVLDGGAAVPGDGLGQWEVSFHQLSGVAELHIDVAATKAGALVKVMVAVQRGDSLLRIFLRLELDETVHGLASGTLHHDMNVRTILGAERAESSSKEGVDILAGASKRDLKEIGLLACCDEDMPKETTYIGDFNDTTVVENIQVSLFTDCGQAHVLQAVLGEVLQEGKHVPAWRAWRRVGSDGPRHIGEVH